MADPDAATAALIAQMLQEENPYGDDVFGGYQDDSDDSDYGSNRKKKKKKKPKKAPPPPKPKKEKPPPKPKPEKAPKNVSVVGEGGEEEGAGAAVEEFSATGRRKRKDTGKVREKARPWNEEEEKLFREALVLHGRDWKKCAEHVGTRDHRSFTSHAQKHFIKMCLQGKPLPRKVAESGEGYTLSGKPLDPNSAAAKAYGFKPDSLMTMMDMSGALPPGIAIVHADGDGDGEDEDGSGGSAGGRDITGHDNVVEEKEKEIEATGAQLIGRDVVKLFDEKPFNGAVTAYDENVGFYKVKYEDGDEEELEIEELRNILVDDLGDDWWKRKGGANGSGGGRGYLTPEESAAIAEAAEKKAAAKAEAEAERERKKAERERAAAERRVERERAATERALERESKRQKREEDAAAKAAAAEPTEYAKNRPRREVGGGSTVVGGQNIFRDAGGGTLDLHPMRRFASATTPGSGAPGSQPFKLTVSPAAMMIMDLHAHLCTNEVIGYLGGSWDPETRTITVERAFPGRGQASGRDVEMDPVAEVELKAQVEAQKLKVVGWYHSHPVFEPTPSGVDIDNQLNYQSLFRDEGTGVEPFVGFIVGPYDLRLPTPVSAVTAFMAQRRRMRDGEEEIPFEVSYDVTDDAPSMLARGSMAAVVVQNKSTAGRVNPTELWRPFTTFTNSTPGGGPCTKLAKLRASLLARLPESVKELEQEEILDGVAKQMQTAWGIDLGY